jgi:hypothetical protein
MECTIGKGGRGGLCGCVSCLVGGGFGGREGEDSDAGESDWGAGEGVWVEYTEQGMCVSEWESQPRWMVWTQCLRWKEIDIALTACTWTFSESVKLTHFTLQMLLGHQDWIEGLVRAAKGEKLPELEATNLGKVYGKLS